MSHPGMLTADPLTTESIVIQLPVQKERQLFVGKIRALAGLQE